MARQIWVTAMMVLAIGAGQAHADVQNSIFEGKVFRTLSLANFGDGNEFESFEVSADFGNDFDLFREVFDGEERLGTYEEDSNGFFSTWNVEYLFDNDHEAFGTSLFGKLTIYQINEIDGDDDFIGILFRTGPSELIDLGPGASR
jgi:hypothetical protein